MTLRRRPVPPTGLLHLGFLVALVAVLAGAPLRARGEPKVQVIGITDGARIAALFEPHRLGAVVVDGWHLAGIRIPATSIEVVLQHADGEVGTLRLLPPGDAAAERTPNFSVHRSAVLRDGSGRDAADRLVEALRKNDVETLWIDPAVAFPSETGKRLRAHDSGRSAGSAAAADGFGRFFREERLEWDREVDGVPLQEWQTEHRTRAAETLSVLGRIERGFEERRVLYEDMAIGKNLWARLDLVLRILIGEGILLWLILVGALAAGAAVLLRGSAGGRWFAAAAVALAGVGVFPWLDVPHHIPRTVMLFLGDGIITILLIIGALAVLTLRRLRDLPPRVGWSLAAILVVGALLRVLLSEPTVMTAWPYVRYYDLARYVYEGPCLSFITWATGTTVRSVDTLHAVTLVMGILGPWAVFLHAHHLTGDDRVALAAGAILAVLPAHIRFSASDVVFIPSIVVSALALVLSHVAVFDGSRRWRCGALIGLLLVLRVLVVMRPLNFVFLLVVGGVIFWLRPGQAPWRRRGLVGAVVLIPAMVAAAANLTSESFAHQTSSGLSPVTLLQALRQLIDPIQNTLINPWITPPLFGLAAVAGAWILIRTRRRLGIFLVLWLGGFFVVHGFIVPEEPAMTARYHLHLAVPFVILAGAALPWFASRAGRWAVPAALGVLATASLQMGFARDVDFAEMQEYRFVREAALAIPEGCWVMEPVERNGIPFRSRLRRVTDELSEGVLLRRVNLVLVDPEDPARLWIHRANGQKEVEDLSLEALMEDPPSCLYFYQGLRCFTVPAAAEGMPPGCVPPDLGATPMSVLSAAWPFRVYDTNNRPPPERRDELFRPTLLRVRDEHAEAAP